MMQSAQTRQRDYGRFRGWLLLDRSAVGRVFAEAIVNSVFVVVVHIIAHQPAKMRFVECDQSPPISEKENLVFADYNSPSSVHVNVFSTCRLRLRIRFGNSGKNDRRTVGEFGDQRQVPAHRLYRLPERG
jgi:hypothetical protein